MHTTPNSADVVGAGLKRLGKLIEYFFKGLWIVILILGFLVAVVLAVGLVYLLIKFILTFQLLHILLGVAAISILALLGWQYDLREEHSKHNKQPQPYTCSICHR